jgi:hypothetical protein
MTTPPTTDPTPITTRPTTPAGMPDLPVIG